MTIYYLTARELLWEYVKRQNIASGQIILKNDIVQYFAANYPKLKSSTITAHIVMMTTNAPSRVYYNMRVNGEDDLFYQVDPSHVRLYVPGHDPSPIYPDAVRPGLSGTTAGKPRSRAA